MIYSLKGTTLLIENGLTVIECNGVGYGCRTTSSSQAGLKVGMEAALYTYLSVRQDAVELFGFQTLSELSCFKMLLTVTGVGAKAALSILSIMSPEVFALTVVSDDYKALTEAPGIGTKSAQRIILELKDKLKKTVQGMDNLSMQGLSSGKTTVGANTNIQQAFAALSVLGFNGADIAKALAKVDGTLSTGEIVKIGLKMMT